MRLIREVIRGSNMEIGSQFHTKKMVTQEMVDQFVSLIGDQNPIHASPVAAADVSDHRVPGALLNGLVSGLIGSHFPGAGSLVVGQEYAFPNKCCINREIDFKLQLVQNRKIMKIAYKCQQNGQVVLTGVANIINRTSGNLTKNK